MLRSRRVTAAAPCPLVRAPRRALARARHGGLFFASLFVSTFEKVHWNFARPASGINDITTILFVVAFLASEREREEKFPRTSAIVLGFFAAFALVYLAGFWDIDDAAGADAVREGDGRSSSSTGRSSSRRSRYLARRGEAFYWRAIGWFTLGFVANSVYGILQLGAAVGAGHNLDNLVLSPLTGGASSIDVFGAHRRLEHLPRQRAHGRSEPPRRDARVPLLALTPVYLRMPRRHRLKWWLAGDARVPAARGDRDALAQRLARARRRRAHPRDPVPPLRPHEAAALPARRARAPCCSASSSRASTSSRRSSASASRRAARRRSRTSPIYSYIGPVLHMHPLLGLGENNFAVYYEFLTGKANFGAHSYWVAVIVESGLLGLLLWIVFLRYVFVRLHRGAAARAAARPDRRRGRRRASGRSRGG